MSSEFGGFGIWSQTNVWTLGIKSLELRFQTMSLEYVFFIIIIEKQRRVTLSSLFEGEGWIGQTFIKKEFEIINIVELVSFFFSLSFTSPELLVLPFTIPPPHQTH